MATKFARLLLWLSLVLFARGRRHFKDNIYSNSWVVFTLKDSKYVEDLAKRHGFIYRGQVGSLDGFHILEHKSISKRMRRSVDFHTNSFLRETHIKYALQQKILRRSKRRFSDPLYTIQWYLNNTGWLLNHINLYVNIKWSKYFSLKSSSSSCTFVNVAETHAWSWEANLNVFSCIVFFPLRNLVNTAEMLSKNLGYYKEQYGDHLTCAMLVLLCKSHDVWLKEVSVALR